MAGGRTLHCTVVTPEGTGLDVDARSVVAPAYDGLVGFLPGHASILMELAPGVVRYTDANNRRAFLFVDGGFAHLVNDDLTIMTEETKTREEAEAGYPAQELLEARAMPAKTTEEVEARDHAMARARELVRLTEMH